MKLKFLFVEQTKTSLKKKKQKNNDIQKDNQKKKKPFRLYSKTKHQKESVVFTSNLISEKIPPFF